MEPQLKTTCIELPDADRDAVFWGLLFDRIVEKLVALAIKYRKDSTRYYQAAIYPKEPRTKTVNLFLRAQWDMPPWAGPKIKQTGHRHLTVSFGWKHYEQLNKFVRSYIGDIIDKSVKQIRADQTETDYDIVNSEVQTMHSTASSINGFITLKTTKKYPTKKPDRQ